MSKDNLLAGYDTEMGFDMQNPGGEDSEGAKEPELDEDDTDKEYNTDEDDDTEEDEEEEEEDESEDAMEVSGQEVDDIYSFIDMFTKTHRPEESLPMSIRAKRCREEEEQERPAKRQAI